MIKAQRGGMEIGGRRYPSGALLPDRYRRQLEPSTRPHDPGLRGKDSPPNMGRMVIPPVQIFSGMLTTLSRAYRSSDEALRHSVENAHMMLHDPMIMGPLLARQHMVALLNWSVESEDDKDPKLKAIAQELTDIVSRTPRFTEYRRSLLEAIWYGRYANQHAYKMHTNRHGTRRRVISRWAPVSGDKILFRYDDGSGDYDPNQIGFRVWAALGNRDKIAGDRELEATGEGMGYFLEPWERRMVCLHRHYIRDGEFEDPRSAGQIHGVGLRHFLYWIWYQKQEALAQVAEIVERTGMGFTIYFYPSGNPTAYTEVKKISQEQAHTNVILMPADEQDQYRVEQIPPNTAGLTALEDFIERFLGDLIVRFILGQTLSSKPSATGMNTGVAELQKDSLFHIVRYDAINLEETLTTELLLPLRDFNYPAYRNVDFWLRISTKVAAPEEELAALQQLWSMGAKLKVSDIFDRLDLSQADEDDETLYNPQIVQAVEQIEAAKKQGQAAPMMGQPGSPNLSPPGSGTQGPTANAGPAAPLDGQPEQMDKEAEESDEKQRLFGPLIYQRSRQELLADIDRAVDATDTDPTEEQREAGNYRKGKFAYRGLTIAIETPKGKRRRPEWPPIAANYGYIKLHESESDGDHVDCFIGPHPESELVFVVDQLRENGRWDEHKTMLGFLIEAEARQAYKDSYSPGWKVGEITALTWPQFRDWLDNGDTSRAIAEQQPLHYARKGKPSPGQKSFDWEESDHPRDADGQWIDKGTSSATATSSPNQPETPEAEDSALTLDEQTLYDEVAGELRKHGITPRSPEEWVQLRRETLARQKQQAEESPPVTPEAAAEEPAQEPQDTPMPEPLTDDNPREAVEAAQSRYDEDYEFARVSSIGNRGEDLKGSARHKVNAWRSLEEAEQDGTAETLTNKATLEKAEPHDYMGFASQNPLGALAAHLALKKFPSKPGRGNERSDSVRDEETKKKDRAQYVEAWGNLKLKFGSIGRSEDDPRRLIDKMRESVGDEISRLRGVQPGQRSGGSDKYNNTANGLVPLYKALTSYNRNKTAVLMQMGQFAKWINDQYQDVSPDERAERTSEHVAEVLEGTSIDKLRGVTKKRGDQFNPADLYVKHAVRKDGRDVPATTANEAVDYMVDKLGMRGVQWGNSVTDDERMHHSKKSAEAMMDLMDVLGLDEDDASLGGKLGFAIGARGHAGASAHYEPWSQVINLTRKSGVGSLAHEWGHFFDHFMQDFEEGSYMSQSNIFTHEIVDDKTGRKHPAMPNDKPSTGFTKQELPHHEVRAAFANWQKISHDFQSRVSNKVHQMVRDGEISKGKVTYWNRMNEIFARSFERYVQQKLESGSRENTYLAGLNWAKTTGNETQDKRIQDWLELWPTNEETEAMTPAFDAIFAAYAKSDKRTTAGKRAKYCKQMDGMLSNAEHYARRPVKSSPGQKGMFDEEQHPRDEGGKFSDKPGGSTPAEPTKPSEPTPPPKPAATMAEEPFSLANAPAKQKSALFENVGGKQGVMWRGLKTDMPGQRDFLEEADEAERQQEREAQKPAATQQVKSINNLTDWMKANPEKAEQLRVAHNKPYDFRVAANMAHLDTKLSEWFASPIKSMVEVLDDKGKMRSMPTFDMPGGYSSAPSLYAGSGAQPECSLCGTPCKNFYPIQNDDKKLTMMVGSECITHFGEGKSGQDLSREHVLKTNRDFVGQANAWVDAILGFTGSATRQTLQNAARQVANEEARKAFWKLVKIMKYDPYGHYRSDTVTASGSPKIMSEPSSDRRIASWMSAHADDARQAISVLSRQLPMMAQTIAETTKQKAEQHAEHYARKRLTSSPGQRSIAWDQEEHPRGQPENAGQFVAKEEQVSKPDVPEELFTLANAPAKKKGAEFENVGGSQQVMWRGLRSDMPGQRDFIQEADEREAEKKRAEVEKPKQPTAVDRFAGLFASPDPDHLPRIGEVKSAIGEEVNQQQATEMLKAVGIEPDDAEIEAIDLSKGGTKPISTSILTMVTRSLLNKKHQDQVTGQALQAAKGSKMVLLESPPYASTGAPRMKLLVHPSTRKKGGWQLTRIQPLGDDPNAPWGHSEHDTMEEAIKSATGALGHMQSDGDADYRVTWTNTSGKPMPFAKADEDETPQREAKAEKIPGGLASGRSIRDFDPKELAQGMLVEMEHTDDPDVALEIAMDHVWEMRDAPPGERYYDLLKKMESQQNSAEASTERPMQYAAKGPKRAPKGGVRIGGQHFDGGEFIPNEAFAAASPEEIKSFREAEAAETTESIRGKAPGTPKPSKFADMGSKLDALPEGSEVLGWTKRQVPGTKTFVWEKGSTAVGTKQLLENFPHPLHKHQVLDAIEAITKPAETPKQPEPKPKEPSKPAAEPERQPAAETPSEPQPAAQPEEPAQPQQTQPKPVTPAKPQVALTKPPEGPQQAPQKPTNGDGQKPMRALTEDEEAAIQSLAGTFGIQPGDIKNDRRVRNFLNRTARNLGFDPESVGDDKNEQAIASAKFLDGQREHLDAVINMALAYGWRGSSAQELAAKSRTAGRFLVQTAEKSGFQSSQGRDERGDLAGAIEHMRNAESKQPEQAKPIDDIIKRLFSKPGKLTLWHVAGAVIGFYLVWRLLHSRR